MDRDNWRFGSKKLRPQCTWEAPATCATHGPFHGFALRGRGLLRYNSCEFSDWAWFGVIHKHLVLQSGFGAYWVLRSPHDLGTVFTASRWPQWHTPFDASRLRWRGEGGSVGKDRRREGVCGYTELGWGCSPRFKWHNWDYAYLNITAEIHGIYDRLQGWRPRLPR